MVYRVEAGRGSRWHLVKESGSAPCGHAASEDYVSPRQGYVVVVVADAPPAQGSSGGRLVAVAQLTRDALWKVKHRVSPLAGTESLSGEFRAGVRVALRGGCLSSGRHCACKVHVWPWQVVCAECKHVRLEQRVFVVAERFRGLFPQGEGHWWRGATDAVDATETNSTARKWLCLREDGAEITRFPMHELQFGMRGLRDPSRFSVDE